MVQSIELHEVGPHGAVDSAHGDGIMNVNEIQLWRLSDGKLTNVARSGTAKLLQNHTDKYHAARLGGGAELVNNGKLDVGGGFQFTTVPVNKNPQSYNNHNYPVALFPVLSVTLKTPVPFSELVSAVIFNRTDTAKARLGKDLVILKGVDGKDVSKVQLPAVTADYVRVDYKSPGTFITSDMATANTRIINVANKTQVVKGVKA